MDMSELKELFIEEAKEIIEKLDVDIIDFEEDPTDKELLNELFRGVHTLKGNSNSFGYARLGEFVHHFEDALDHYRSSKDEITSHGIDIFLEAVDILKEILDVEIEGNEELPPQYDKCLTDIKALLSSEKEKKRIAEKHKKQEEQKRKQEEAKESVVKKPDLAEEFGFDEKLENSSSEDVEELKSESADDKSLYGISLKFDDDIYFRGLDHSKIFKLLSKEGEILESYWDMSNIPKIDKLNTVKSYIKNITIYFATNKEEVVIREIFEYMDDYEYSLKKIYTHTRQASKRVDKKEIKLENKETKLNDKETKLNEKTKNITKAIPQKRKKKGDTHSYVKIDTNKLDELFDSIGELVIAQNFLSENRDIQTIKNENVTKTINVLSKTTRLIQNRVMSLRMVPIQDTFEKMKRVVRDASKKVQKEIILEVEGAETEIDKTMIDSLSDPLIHIVRNAIDHGIEDNIEERKKLEKNAAGTVMLKAYHRGGKIAIEISDDGRGINRDKVLKKAIERGVVSEDEELTDTQVFNLIMQPGFSTAETISDISGRGVGLDVVKNSIEKLNGKVEISSMEGKGSTFIILLPLTLAIIDGMLVQSEEDTYILPTLSVVESFVPSKDIVHTFKDEGEFVDLRGEMIPIVRLNELLLTGSNRPNIWESTLVCVENENGKFAILIDELVGRQQVVIKPLGHALSGIKEFSGSAVMGNGEIALILNVDELWGQKEIKE